MSSRRYIFVGVFAAMMISMLQAQSPVLTSIETPPYPHLPNSVTIAGISYAAGTVAYSPVSATLILHGSNFGTSGTVRFLGYKYANGVRTSVSTTQVQLTAPSWQSTSIVVSVPSIAQSGTIQVANSNGTSSELPFFISSGSLPASCPVFTPLRITTTSLPDGTVSQTYSTILAAIGGTQPYSWSIIGGTLPSGLTLNASTGVISGTPTTSTLSPVSITVQVSDNSSPQTTNQTVLNVTIHSGVNLGSQYSYCISASPDAACASPSAGYDAAGNIISFYDSVIGTWAMTNGYDSLNRLTSANVSGSAYQGLQANWSYDAFGNRLTENFSATNYTGTVGVPPSTSFGYDSKNRINSTVSGFAPHYDDAGNLQCEIYDTSQQPNQCAVSPGANVYLYDGEGRVCAVTTASGMFGYLYNAEGTRIAKGTITNFTCDTNPSDQAYNHFTLTTSYILGLSNEQVTELNRSEGTATPAHSNVFAGGQLIATYTFNSDPNAPSPGTLNFHLTDWVGTRRALLDYSGVIQQVCHGLPFGSQDCLPTPTEHLFTGKEHDSESGNDYFGARYYASSMGRWLSPDWSAKITPVPYAKLDNPQSLNLYAYVYDNPLNNVDPDGHLGCGFLWLGNCPTAPLAPPPPPPAPPALAVAGTPPSNLAAAQTAARNNPANAPTGVPGTPERTTHCNQATCQIAAATNAPTGALLDKNGKPNLANTDAKTIANSSDWGKVSPQTAQDLATLGVTVLGVRPEDPHGHIVTVAPEMLPGDQNVQKNGPLINNIGGSIGVTNANNVFRGTPATYYAPTTPQW